MNNNSNKLRPQRDRIVGRSKSVGLGMDRPSSGFGNIIIPSDVNRSEYISHSYRTGTCMIVTSFNDIYKDVRVPVHVLEAIKFPAEPGEYGTLVAWQNTPMINQVTLVGIIVSPNEIYPYGENGMGRNRSVGSNSFGESVNVTDERVDYSSSINNSFSQDGGMKWSAAGSEGRVSSLDLFLDGTTRLYSDQRTDVESYDEVNLIVGHEDEENRSRFTIKNTGVFEYVDFNGNFLRIQDGNITFESSEGEIIHGEGATESAMLGDVTQTELNKLSARVDLLYNAIQGGVPVAQDGGVGLQQTMNAILQAAVDEDFSNILSTVNKIK